MTQAQHRALVLYDSPLGSTAEVARSIAAVLQERGWVTDLKPLDAVDDMRGYARVIVGAPIRYDRWSPRALTFLKTHEVALQGMDVACFFTCLTLAKPTPEARRKADLYADGIRQAVPGVTPVAIGQFAGVLEFARVPWLARIPLWVLSRVTGVPAGDYRDWEAIRDWAMGLDAVTEPVSPGLMRLG